MAKLYPITPVFQVGLPSTSAMTVGVTPGSVRHSRPRPSFSAPTECLVTLGLTEGLPFAVRCPVVAGHDSGLSGIAEKCVTLQGRRYNRYKLSNKILHQ